MKKITFKRTSMLKALEHGLVDYIATGILIRDQEEIPCEIGYTQYNYILPDKLDLFSTNIDKQIESVSIEPTHIFIKAGIAASGTHYEDETIEL